MRRDRSIQRANECEERALRYARDPSSYQSYLGKGPSRFQAASLQFRTAAMYYENAALQTRRDEDPERFVELMRKMADNAERGALQEGQSDPEWSAFNFVAWRAQVLRRHVDSRIRLKLQDRPITRRLLLEWLGKSRKLGEDKRRELTKGGVSSQEQPQLDNLDKLESKIREMREELGNL